MDQGRGGHEWGEARLCECVRIPEAVFEGVCIALPAVSTEAFGNKADGLEVERGGGGGGGGGGLGWGGGGGGGAVWRCS